MPMNIEAQAKLMEILVASRKVPDNMLEDWLEEQTKDTVLLGYSFDRFLEQYGEFRTSLGEDYSTIMKKSHLVERKVSLMDYCFETITEEVGTVFDETAFMAVESVELPFLYAENRHRVPNLKKLLKEAGVDCYNWSDECLFEELGQGVYRLGLDDEKLIANYKYRKKLHEKSNRNNS